MHIPENSCCPLQHILIFEASQREIEGFSIAHAYLTVLIFAVCDPEMKKFILELYINSVLSVL